jgi:hypothetical protein
VNYFDEKFGNRVDLRKITDRRRQALACRTERRFQADRRLNNIRVEWIPFEEVYSHPDSRDVFRSISRKSKKAVQAPAIDARENEPSGQTRCEKEQPHVKSWRPDIFRRAQRADVEQRTTADRRTRNIKLPYNRRVRPDRRLNKIAFEWIEFE